ncbi:MAG: 6,7-dimethyl-8-ribityllumazine synthase [Bacteroidales bacterium]|nr:6,7-dimethyl-8-ribityllumazine synthase [Bacteroidales bacterium]MCR5192647.1 6,7-dimethyl-8-ribityllumazine synthase [Bacteroidales bacterium]
MKKTNLSEYDPTQVPSGKDFTIGLAVAEWNSEITNALAQGALDTLRKYDVKEENIKLYHVPGSFELSTAADLMLTNDKKMDAVICIGCVIQGETRHFDFICEAVSQGVTNVSIKHGRPVIFSLLTTNDMQQAKDRAGGKHGNKGVEGAVTALKMVAFQKRLESF